MAVKGLRMNATAGVNQEASPSLLILLVGSNPVPNYLSACALRPDRIALVYTDETTAAKDRLKQELKRELGNTVTFVDPDPRVADATSATTVQRVISGLLKPANAEGGPAEVWLNYTGGTKVMAAHARMSYDTSGVKAKHASYLDEGGKRFAPQLRFDDGTSKELSKYADVPLTLETMLALHGVKYDPRTAWEPAPTTEDAKAILGKVLLDVPLAAVLYCERQRLEEENNPVAFVEAPFRGDQYGLTLSLPEFPTGAQLDSLANRKARNSWFAQWYKFIGGEWLEEWVGEQIRQILPDSTVNITVGINAKRGQKEVQLEVDVAVIRGHRSYFISCTTDTTKPICKSKLFEVTVRARNLGGDLSRAALVCLADEKTVTALRNDAEDVWGASNITQVFGLDDIKTWSGHGGEQPNLYSLKTWLES